MQLAIHDSKITSSCNIKYVYTIIWLNIWGCSNVDLTFQENCYSGNNEISHWLHKHVTSHNTYKN